MESFPFESAIAIADSATALPALAAVQVVSTLLDLHPRILYPEEIKQGVDLSEASFLLLPEAHVSTYLAILRLQGYGGAVIVIASQPFTNLTQRYPILRSQTGTHAAWGAPWQIATLLQLIPTLNPLEFSNLEDLQMTLRLISDQRDRQLETVLFPCLDQLQQPEQDFLTVVQTLDDTFSDLLIQTRDASHTSLRIDGSQKSLRFHFQQIIETLRRSQSSTTQQADNLKKILEKWRDEVRRTGEGLDTWQG